MYEQVIPFDPSKGGTVPGGCLQNVRSGYGIPAKYPNAITASQHTVLHRDKNFPALDVPVYYTFEVDGHINVHLKDGRCWSDGTIYTSVDDYLSKHPKVSFIGWGESVNDVAVIKQGGEEMVTDQDHLNALFRMCLLRNANNDELKLYLNNPAYPYSKLVEMLEASPERAPITNIVQTGTTAVKDDWHGQILGLESKLQAIKDFVNK